MFFLFLNYIECQHRNTSTNTFSRLFVIFHVNIILYLCEKLRCILSNYDLTYNCLSFFLFIIACHIYSRRRDPSKILFKCNMYGHSRRSMHRGAPRRVVEFICKCNYFVLSFIYNFMSARTIRLELSY